MSKKEVIILLIILTIAAFFRLWNLDSIPPGFYPDEAINGNEAITSPGQIFYPENNGREGLFINLIALSFSAFGISIWSLRFVSALIGILTCLGLYLLTKELFYSVEKSSRQIALLSSFFLAISFWHTNFSRIGFRGILVPFILVFSFYFLFRGFRTKKLLYFIISGLFFGLGFYTYISYRFVIFLLLLVLIGFWFFYREQNLRKNFLFSTCYLLLATFIIALPIGIYFLQNPKDFISRASGVSIFAQPNPALSFGISFIRHLGMFNFYGDPNWRHNFAGSPQLLWPIGLLFLIGIGISLKQTVKSFREKDYSLFTIHYSLISWFFIMLLPGILTYEGIPHALRTIGVIPVIYIFVALGGYNFYNWFNKKIKSKKLFLILCFLFLASLSFAQFYKYSFCWTKNPEVEGAFYKRNLKIGNYLNSLAPEIKKYVIVNQLGVLVNGIPVPAQTPMFIERIKFGFPQSIYLLPRNLNQIKINKTQTIIIPLDYNEELFNELYQRFHSGKLQKEDNIWFYKINF